MIHAVGLGDIRKHRVVEDQAAGIPHPGNDKDAQEPEPVADKAQPHAAEQAHPQKEQEDGLFISLGVGKGAEHRSQYRHQQGSCRGRIAPVGQILHIGKPGLFRQKVEVDGNDGGNQQGEGRVAHIVEDPAALRRGEFQFAHAGSPCSGRGSKVRP